MSVSEQTALQTTLMLLSLSGLALVGTQLRIAGKEKPQLEAQLNASALRLSSAKSAQSQMNEALQKRDEQVRQAAQIEGKYAALLSELIELSKSDADARSITQKWKIQQQGDSQPSAAAGKTSPESKSAQAVASPSAASTVAPRPKPPVSAPPTSKP